MNRKGVMGAGLAKQFKERHPRMYESYCRHCARGLLWPGCIMAVHVSQDEPRKWVINMAVTDDWRNPSRLEWVEATLEGLRRFIDQQFQSKKPASIGIPALGCGLGGLDWEKVKPLIERHIAGLDPIRVVVFEPK